VEKQDDLVPRLLPTPKRPEENFIVKAIKKFWQQEGMLV
jgi:hypothetical protein